MGKIICDVCGTSYPETATQCPICGCVRSGDSVTIAGDTHEVDTQKPAEYTYVKGGRFSKANVKKRNAGKPIYNVEPTQKPQRPAAKKEDGKKEELAAGTNKAKSKKSELGLIIVIIALLVAIAAVVVYITCSALGVFSPKNNNAGSETTDTIATVGTEESTEADIACETLEVDELSLDIVFTAVGQKEQINVFVTPENTTDRIIFYSEDADVADVNENGEVTAMGKGVTIIHIECGDQTAECSVTCDFDDDATDPENNTESTEPTQTDPTETTAPDVTYTEADFTLYSKDVTFYLSSCKSFNIYTGKIPAGLIVWKSNDEKVATVENGVVKFVGVGRAIISATYNGITLECIVRINY